MPVSLANTDSHCCEYWHSERLVARVISAWGEAHKDGQHYCLITVSVNRLSNVVDALSAWWEVRQVRSNCATLAAYRVSDTLLHADFIYMLLLETETWVGSWVHVCRMLGWCRPDVVRVLTEQSVVCNSCATLASQNESLRQQVQDLISAKRYLQRKLDRLQEKLSAQSEELQHLRQHGPNRFHNPVVNSRLTSRLSSRGSLELAPRCSTNNSKYHNLGLCLGIDVPRQTVSACQIKLRATRLAFIRSWYHAMYMELLAADSGAGLEEADDNISYTIACHSLMCDATSSGIWKKTHKLHSLKVTSTFVTSVVRPDSSWADIVRSRHTKAMMGDLQLIGAGHSGRHALAMMHKQVRSVGNIWHAPVQVPALEDNLLRPQITSTVLPDLQHRGPKVIEDNIAVQSILEDSLAENVRDDFEDEEMALMVTNTENTTPEQ